MTLQVILYGDQLQMVNRIDDSATSKSPCREFSYKYVAVEIQNIIIPTEKNSAINKSLCKTTSHSVENSATNNSLHKGFSYKKATQ